MKMIFKLYNNFKIIAQIILKAKTNNKTNINLIAININ